METPMLYLRPFLEFAERDFWLRLNKGSIRDLTDFDILENGSQFVSNPPVKIMERFLNLLWSNWNNRRKWQGLTEAYAWSLFGLGWHLGEISRIFPIPNVHTSSERGNTHNSIAGRVCLEGIEQALLGATCKIFYKSIKTTLATNCFHTFYLCVWSTQFLLFS